MAAEIGILLLKLAVILGVAKLAGELAERVRQPAVLGELLAGVLLGPSLFGLLDFGHASAEGSILAFVASLGVVLLLFEVGLQTRLSEMTKVGTSSALVALIGIVGSFAAGFGISWLLGSIGFWSHHLLFHIFVGATFTATSVGITARVLSDLGRLATPEARIVLGAAVLDDVGGLLILAAVTALAAGALHPGALASQGLLAVGFLLAVLVVGTRVMPWVVSRVARARQHGMLTAGAVAFALLVAWGAEQFHLAAIVGAFAAGVVLAGTREQPQLEGRIRPLAEVLVPLFFVYVGAQVDLRGIGDDGVRLAIATVVLTLVAILGKLASGLGVVQKGVSRYAVGVGMVPRGEVGLIFALVGLTTMVNGVPLMAPWEYAAILLVVAITTFVTPWWLAHSLRAKPAPAAAPASLVVPEDGAEA